MDKEAQKKLEFRIEEQIHYFFQQFNIISSGDIEEGEVEYLAATKQNLLEAAETLYFLIFVFIESKGLLEYLKLFAMKFGARMKNIDQLLEEYKELESGDDMSLLYVDLLKFLNPITSKQIPAEHIKNLGIVYLERVLKNTDRFLAISKTIIKKEADIYNAVKPFIEIFFPQTMPTNRYSILNKLKVYKPDIFIPSLKCTVEYKFIKQERDIAKCISEIADDTIGYEEKIGTNEFILFYSVFYIKGTNLTEDRFQELWKERKYPKSWKGIPVFERNKI
jgi:hypothetical protein